MLHEVRIKISGTDQRGCQLLREIEQSLGITSITAIQTVKVYRFEGSDKKAVQQMSDRLLAEHINQIYSIDKPLITQAQKKIEVGYKPAVMNPEISSLYKAATDLHIVQPIAADTSWEYHFYGELTDQQIKLIKDRLLVNKTIERVILEPPKTLVISGHNDSIETIALNTMSDDELIACAKKHQLYLQIHEMKAIQNYFKQIGRDPYDAELETIAQTWSEHCLHKTFKSELDVGGKKKEPLIKRLMNAAACYSDQVISAFVDNAGALQFYDGYAILGKVETHNSPSAIEPYGGAATGSGGVFRDIMGTGQGAKVIASTDMFCFAQPTLDTDALPPGCLHPKYLLQKVVAGVRDYGNRMGIPTNNGSVHFHKDFRAKPTVIVGAYGLAPEIYCKQGTPQPGDLIFVVGGKTGRDGIHGATFSSGQMTSETINVNASAVQIGNPIEEKRMTDALLACRDKQLIRAITDCGAGGFSSAIGEMASTTGAHVQLEKAPLKYQGLAPWEIWVSESQERMICCVPKEQAQQFQTISTQHNVQATNIGYFTKDNRLYVTFNGKELCHLEMHFLHHGYPKQTRVAKRKNQSFKEVTIPIPIDMQAVWLDVLAHWNIASKEPIVRQYDHGVQGTNALSPFTGKQQQGPSDAVVLTPLLGKPYGLIISHGMNPILNRLDPYKGALWAVAECMANLVAVGGNCKDVGLIDNFIWPYPNEQFLWALDQAIEACVDTMHTFKVPFISGKDSLSSTYTFNDGTDLNIPPVLCISAFGKIPDVSKTVSSDFKQSNALILLVGELDLGAMGGSTYLEITTQYFQGSVPNIHLKALPHRFTTIHQLINQETITACHDISEGGLAITLSEMCFGGNLGATIDLCSFADQRADYVLFNETAGCFLVEIPEHLYNKDIFNNVSHAVIGRTTKEQHITVKQHNNTIIKTDLGLLLKAWQQPFQKVFGT